MNGYTGKQPDLLVPLSPPHNQLYKMNHCFAFLFLLLTSTALHAQSNGDRIAIAMTDSLLKSQIERKLIPGAVIEIKKAGKVLLKKAYGYANAYSYDGRPLSKPEPVTTDHLYDIASLTKVIGTTTAIMLLADQGKLVIDNPVSKYCKGFDVPDKKNISIRQLLTHTSGLPDWYPMYYRSNNKPSTYALIASLPLKYPSGKERHYSDLGFTILGQIIETVSGMPLEEYVDKKIFQPLGMTHSTYNPLSKGFYKIAATSHGNPYEKRMVYDSTLGYQYKEIIPDSWNGWRNYTLRGEVNDGNAWYANGGVSGAAGLFATVGDLQLLVDMLMNKGKVGKTVFISEATLSKFLTKDRFLNGLGWMMDPANSFMKGAPEGSFGHTGFTGTSITVVPMQKLSIILLVNRQNTGLNEKGEYYNLNALRMGVYNIWK